MKSGWNPSKISAAFLAGILLVFCSWILAFAVSGGMNRIPTAHADTASATSSPSSGPVGAIIHVMGSGWTSIPNGTIVSFGYSTNSNCSSAILPADSPGMMNNGAFYGWFRWPRTAEGNYMVCAFMPDITAPANTYTVLSQSPPQVSISPSSSQAAQQATISGSNYLPANTSVSLVLQSTNGANSVLLGSTFSDINGNFSETFTVPGNMTGSDLIVANAGGGQPQTLSSSVPFTVKAPQPVASPTPNSGPTPLPTAPPVPTTTMAGAPATNPTTVAKAPTATTHATMTPTATPNFSNNGITGTVTPSIAGGTTGSTSTGNSRGGYSSNNTSSSHSNFSLGIISIGALIFLVIILLSALLLARRLLSSSRMKNYPPSGMTRWTRSMKSVYPPVASNAGTSPMEWNEAVGNMPAPPVAGPAMQTPSLRWPTASTGLPPGLPDVSATPPQSPLPLDPSVEARMRDAQQGLFAAPRQR